MPDDDARPDESHRHQKAFAIYLSLGDARTYRQVAERMGVSLASVKRYAKADSWSTKVAEREAQIARQVADRTLESAVEDLERKRKLVKAAFIRLGQAIASGNIKMQLADLDRLIRLDALLQGHPEGVLIGSAMGAGSVEELRLYLEMTPTYILNQLCAQKAEGHDRRLAEEQERQQQRAADPEGPEQSPPE